MSEWPRIIFTLPSPSSLTLQVTIILVSAETKNKLGLRRAKTEMLLLLGFKNSAALLPNSAVPFRLQVSPSPSPSSPYPVHLQPLLPPSPAIWDPRIPRQAKECQLPKPPHLTSHLQNTVRHLFLQLPRLK